MQPWRRPARRPTCERSANRSQPLEAEELIKSLRHQPQSQFAVSGPKQAVNMQRECYERSVFRIYVGAQPPTLHPSAYRYHALVHECEPRKDGVQVIQQFVLVQFRQRSDSFFMLEKLNYDE